MTARRACDVLSCCFRHKVQRLVLLKILWRPVMLVTVRPAISSRSSESRFQYPNFRILSVLERDPLDGPSCPWRSVVGSVVSASFSRNKICCSKRLNRSLHEVLLGKCFQITIVVMIYSIVGKQSYWHSGFVINIKLEFEVSVMIKRMTTWAWWGHSWELI